MWRAHLLDTLLHNMVGMKWVFITLTAPPWAHKTPIKSLINLKKGWDKLYDKLRYKNGGSLSYVMLYETHRSGAFHVHALVAMGEIYDAYTVPIDRTMERERVIEAEKNHPFGQWLKDKATDAKMGWVCHATRVWQGETGEDNQRLAVAYLSKYLTKGASELIMPSRWRRIGTSRDIGSPKTKSKKEFTWHIRQFVTAQDIRHIPHYVISENRVLDPSDIGDDGMYPGDAENA